MLVKNIKTNDGVTSYINNMGNARGYNDNTFTKRHKTCGSGDPLKVNAIMF